jgi:hypothetical protein
MLVDYIILYTVHAPNVQWLQSHNTYENVPHFVGEVALITTTIWQQ